MRALRALLPLILLLALALSAAAQAPDAQQVTGQAVNKTTGLLDKVAHGLGSAAKGVGNAAGSAADGMGSAAGAVGRFVRAVATAIADGAAATLSALAGVAGSLSSGLADLGANLGLASITALGAVGSGLGATLAAVGAGLVAAGSMLGSAIMATGRALGGALAWIGAQFAALFALYARFVASLRPRAVPEPAFAAMAAAGAASAVAASGWGLLSLARRFGWLLGGAGVAGFSRIEDDELLKHPLRAQVFQVIQGNPGIHASELGRRMGTGWGTIVHHLDKLEKGRLVTVRKVNNQKCYFEDGGKVSRQDMAVAGAVRSDSANRITGYVATHPMTSQKALAAELGISPALASFHVKKLVGLGVLDKVRNGKETLLTTTDALRRIVAGESAAVAPPLLAPMPMTA